MPAAQQTPTHRFKALLVRAEVQLALQRSIRRNHLRQCRQGAEVNTKVQKSSKRQAIAAAVSLKFLFANGQGCCHGAELGDRYNNVIFNYMSISSSLSSSVF
jgi:hypothetical protein